MKLSNKHLKLSSLLLKEKDIYQFRLNTNTKIKNS